MTITVRHLRSGVAVRLTGAHARVFTGLLADLLGRDAPEPVPQQTDLADPVPGTVPVTKDAAP